MSRGISVERYRARLRGLQAAVAAEAATAALVGVGPELEWLTGYAAHGGERLNLLVDPGSGPDLVRQPAAGGSGGTGFTRSRRGCRRAAGVGGDRRSVRPGAAARGDAAGARRFLVSDGLRAAFVLGLQAVLPGATWGVASAVLAPMRRVKDAEEVASAACCRRGRRPRCRARHRRAAGRPHARPMWPGTCATHWSTRATTRPSSGSWPRVPTAPRRTTSRASASSAPASRCCSTSAGAAPATARISRAPSGSRARTAPGPDAGFATIYELTAAGAGRRPCRGAPRCLLRRPRCDRP